jgi:hypothetical protein
MAIKKDTLDQLLAGRDPGGLRCARISRDERGERGYQNDQE